MKMNPVWVVRCLRRSEKRRKFFLGNEEKLRWIVFPKTKRKEKKNKTKQKIMLDLVILVIE